MSGAWASAALEMDDPKSRDVSLKEHLESRLRSVEERLQTHERAQYREIEQATKKSDEARVALETRLVEMNQMRAQILAERGEFVTRDMLDARIIGIEARLTTIVTRLESVVSRDVLDARLQSLALRLEVLERTKSNLEGRLWMFVTGLTILSIVIQTVTRYIFAAR